MQLRKFAVVSSPFWNDFGHKLKILPDFSSAFLPRRLLRARPINLRYIRPYCENKVPPGKALKDILKESNSKRMKDHYPELNKRKHAQQLSLSELIQDLKGNPAKSREIGPAFEAKEDVAKTIYHVSKKDPTERVNALNKHFDFISLRQGKENLSLHKQQKIDIIPDNSEVGELLKSLINKGQFSEDKVKTILSNIKPEPEGSRNRMQFQYVKEKLDQGELKQFSSSKQRRQQSGQRSKLFDGPNLRYFDLSLQAKEHENDSRFVSIHEIKWQQTIKSSVPKLGPTNAFEALMLEADKFWKFPIDNEINMGSEEQSTFEDHVFLSEHLDMFPKTGQIRRFMELVITGLQQNPYCSVQEKIDKIYWFKNYFDTFSDEDLEF